MWKSKKRGETDRRLNGSSPELSTSGTLGYLIWKIKLDKNIFVGQVLFSCKNTKCPPEVVSAGKKFILPDIKPSIKAFHLSGPNIIRLTFIIWGNKKLIFIHNDAQYDTMCEKITSFFSADGKIKRNISFHSVESIPRAFYWF